MVSKILAVGFSDSSAGTGIQADLKTAQAYDVYAATALTAVAVQDTNGVAQVHKIPADFVKDQIEKVMLDIQPSVIKAGMLACVGTINVLGDVLDDLLEKGNPVKFVLDPVMTAKSEENLLDKEARDALKRRLMLRADIITPNIKEAQELSGLTINDVDDMCNAAETLRTLGAKTVILKGGSIATDTVYEVLADDNGVEIYQRPKLDTRSTHGAGTTLSAAIASGLSLGLNERDAFVKARGFVELAMQEAQNIGSGFGPLNHNVKP